MTLETPSKRRTTFRQTELRRTSQHVACRLAMEAADRERRLVLTAKIDRVWSALVRLRAKVGAARFSELMVNFPDASEGLHSADLCGVAEFHDILGSDEFRTFLAELAEALDTGSDPCAFWARWLEVLVVPRPALSSR